MASENQTTVPPMTRLRFASAAARIAERAAGWAADSTYYPEPDRQGEPMPREAALRFCTAIETLTAFIREEVQNGSE